MKKATSKNGKAISSLDVVNIELKGQFESVVNLEAEISVFEVAVRMLNAGTISVRGLKATIESASEKGALPTIKPSTAQYFALAHEVRSLNGGKEKALKTVLNTTIQAKRAFGKETLSKIQGAKSFADFAGSVPSQGERAKAKRKASAKVDLLTVDAYVSMFMGVKELESLKVSDVEQWGKFLSLVKTISESNRANHPAIRAKVSA